MEEKIFTKKKHGLVSIFYAVEPPIKDTPRRGQPLYKGQFIISQNNHFSYILDLREEDNLSIVDEIAGPNVSFIQRLHCT